MNCPEYFFSQHILNPQPYNVDAHQNAYVLLVILLPQHLLEPLLYVLALFPRLFTSILTVTDSVDTTSLYGH